MVPQLVHEHAKYSIAKGKADLTHGGGMLEAVGADGRFRDGGQALLPRVGSS